MSDVSAVLNLPYIQPAQAQKHLTHNEAIQMLDQIVQLSVASDDLTAPPASPATGARFIVGVGAGGDWAGKDGHIAHFDGILWRFTAPQAGFVAYVGARNQMIAFNGTDWQALAAAAPPAVDTVPELGIGTAADPNNVLSVKGGSTLFSHDGAGHRVTVNKNAVSDTASFVFQTGWSGRYEFGLTGDDNFTLKSSIDGASWSDCLRVVPQDDALELDLGLRLSVRDFQTLPPASMDNEGILHMVTSANLTQPELIYSNGHSWRRVRTGGLVS